MNSTFSSSLKSLYEGVSVRQQFLAVTIAVLMTSTAFADSNGVVGGVLNTSETISLDGVLGHGGNPGDASNSTVTLSFANAGFNANSILIEGEATGVVPYEGNFFLGEADIVVTDPAGGEVVWNNFLSPVPETNTGPNPYSSSTSFDSVPAAGDWVLEFVDDADDGEGPDTNSSNVTVTLREVVDSFDENGDFQLGAVAGGTATSVGEFLEAGLWDEYSITLTQDGTLDVVTSMDAGGILGRTLDTQIGVFDSSGTLILFNDDGDASLFSAILDEPITAGDYTIVVTGFESNFDQNDIGTLQLAGVAGGTELGDYALTVTLSTDLLLGDVNLDGEVNFLDIAPFISILSANGFQAEADIDQSGGVNFLDIVPFIAILAQS